MQPTKIFISDSSKPAEGIQDNTAFVDAPVSRGVKIDRGPWGIQKGLLLEIWKKRATFSSVHENQQG